MRGNSVNDTTFSTSTVQTPQQFDIWCEALCNAFGEIEVTRHLKGDFSGSFKTCQRAQLQFNEIHYSGQTVERTLQNLNHVDQEYFTFGRPVSGPLMVEQNQSSFVITPGSLVLVNQTTPYKASAPQSYHVFSISIPATFLRQRVPNIGSYFKIEASHERSRVELLTNFAKHIEEGITDWSDIEMLSLREQLLDLITLLMVNNNSKVFSSFETSIKSAHRERAITYLKHHHQDSSLDPETIAAACGISPNYLHKVFRSANLQVMDLVFAQRLDTGKRLLLEPGSNEKTIQQIAYTAGFKNASHFSQMFKEKFGMSPRNFRDTKGVPLTSGLPPYDE
jgi:AraC-like DNA-binding protein